jgi:hypothetical protein
MHSYQRTFYTCGLENIFKVDMDGYVGRVNLSAPPSAGGSGTALGDGTKAGSFSGFGYKRTTETDFTADMLRGNWEKTPLSESFFSQKNAVIIQN